MELGRLSARQSIGFRLIERLQADRRREAHMEGHVNFTIQNTTSFNGNLANHSAVRSSERISGINAERQLCRGSNVSV